MDKTSYSDDGTYPHFCQLAANDDATFSSFRSNKKYKQIVETCGPNAGKNYLYLALQKQPTLGKYFKQFALSERIGDPKLFDYTVGNSNYRLAPTTLRYINVLTDLMTYFGSLDGLKIAEIGGGYGGQCKIIRDVFTFDHYTLIDLAPALALSKRFLSEFSISNVSFISPSQLDSLDSQYDLIISNYAFTEISRELQEEYWSRLVCKTNHGYMLCNFATHTWQKEQFSKQNLIEKIENVNVVSTAPPLSQLDVQCSVVLLWW